MDRPDPPPLPPGPPAGIPSAASPPAVPLQPLPYFDDAATAGPWLRLVKVIGLVAVVVGAADLVLSTLQLVSAAGGPAITPFGTVGTTTLRFRIVPLVGGAVTSLLLLIGGIACVTRSPSAARLMRVYAVTALGLTLFNALFASLFYLPYTVSRLASEPGWVLWYALSYSRTIAFPVVVYHVMSQPVVRDLFGGGGGPVGNLSKAY